MKVQEIDRGLWRWELPHPSWKPENDRPGGWGRMVGCVYAEPAILIDPLAPPAGTPESDQFWAALDADVERSGGPVRILLGNEYHSRSAQAVYDRYNPRPGASIWAHDAGRDITGCRVTDAFPEEGKAGPAGVITFSIPTLSPAEIVFYLPDYRTIVPADALIGAGAGKLRVVPASWGPQDERGATRYQKEFRSSLRRLLDLDFDRVLVSHGSPVLENGRAALASALEAPACGDAADGS